MKALKRIGVISMTILLVAGGAGCGRFGKGNTDDPNTLYVGNYQGGLGKAWLEEIANKFEAENPGINVEIDEEKDRFGDSMLLQNIKHFRQDVYFLNQITYSNYVNAGVLADITDVVTEKRAETRLIDGVETVQSVSIEEKMDDYLADYYKWDEDERYYAIPFYNSAFGAVYDVDLFDQMKYYFRDGYTSLEDNPFVTTLEQNTEGGKRTAGVDGEYGTSDDGLPATYDELFALMDQMKLDNVIPFMWNGQYYNYRERFFASLWADYEGKENYNLNSSFDGDYVFPAGVLTNEEAAKWNAVTNTDGSQTVKISNANAYLLQKQTGKRIAVKFAHDIIRGGYYRTDSFDTTSSHLMTQVEYLYSRQKKAPVAFILEGSWWESEARDQGTFATMAKQYNSNEPYEQWGFGERKFAFLPVPKSPNSSNQDRRTLLSASGGSVVCINKKTSKLDLAKKFLAFAHTDESLRIFTRVTGVPRAYDYELSNDDLEQMTYFSRDLWKIYSDAQTDIVYHTIFENTMRSTEKSYFNVWAFGATNVNGIDYSEPLLAFRTLTNLTVDDYMDRMLGKYSDWNSRLTSYLS